MKLKHAILTFVILAAGSLAGATDPAAHVPAQAPRTSILAGRHEAFRAYVTAGPGAKAFARIKADFDARCFTLPFPEEPLTYGDPAPEKRDSAKVDLWRGAQDVCGQVSAVAEAAATIWIATGEARYLAKAKEWLLRACGWSLDASAWPQGPCRGATDVYYNDEAHFRLWRKLPLVYDQIREQLSAGERATVLEHFRVRGQRSFEWIRATGRIEHLKRNSLEVAPTSHPVRFMPMTGLTALALWDDLPETRAWWDFAYTFYRDQFTPWGGDDGGWAEGVAYWRGVIEHASLQDALFAIGDPLAYATPFWRNTCYFQVYNVQPYRHTAFGDLSNAGRFNLEPVVADFLEHVARISGDGHLLTYAALLEDPRTPPADAGLANLDRIYPNATEFLFRNFIASTRPAPVAQSLAGLPPQRHFADVGWVSLHSALGRPRDDIHATFVSSPYGSFSHSHAHQNAFVLNAYGENLAIASGYREFHNSPHHDGWTRLTASKNAVLIDGKGQKPKDKSSTGRITQFETHDEFVWSTGDATRAYQAGNPDGGIERVTRDIVFVDRRFLVVRDVVRTTKPSTLTWLLHAEREIAWDAESATATITTAGATLTTRLLQEANRGWNAKIVDRFPVPIDPKYVTGSAANYQSQGDWSEQSHFSAETRAPAAEHVIYAVLWPERGAQPPPRLGATLTPAGALEVELPDGRRFHLFIDDERVQVDRRE